MHQKIRSSRYGVTAAALIIAAGGLAVLLGNHPSANTKREPMVLGEQAKDDDVSLEPSVPSQVALADGVVPPRMAGDTERLAKGAPIADRHDAFGTAVRQAQDVFARMHSVRGRISQDKVRREAARSLLGSREGRLIVEKVLTDPSFALHHFGDMAAESRYYATKVTGEAARNGDTEFGIRIAAAIASAVDKNIGPQAPGRGEDLIEVLREVAQGAGATYVTANRQQLARGLGVANPESLSLATRTQMGMGLFMGLGESMGLREARTFVEGMMGLTPSGT